MENDPQAKDILWLPIVFIALLLFGMNVEAASYQVKDTAGNTVTINDTRCPASFLKGWKAGQMVYKGKVYKACWTLNGPLVIVIDSEGEITPVPVESFKPATEG